MYKALTVANVLSEDFEGQKSKLLLLCTVGDREFKGRLRGENYFCNKTCGFP